LLVINLPLCFLYRVQGSGSADVVDSEVNSLNELSLGEVRRGFVVGHVGDRGGLLVRLLHSHFLLFV
jgi:hypothetical protein